MEGYIKLYRKSMNNEFFLEMPYDRWHAFEYLLLSARFKPTEIIIKGKTVHLEAGQTIFGENYLAQKWGWSRQKVRRFLDQLSEHEMIHKVGTPYGTLITIVNYTLYQGERTSIDTALQTQIGTADKAADGTADETHIKKEKNEKNVIKNIINAHARESHADGVSFSVDKFTPHMRADKQEKLEDIREEIKRRQAAALAAVEREAREHEE